MYGEQFQVPYLFDTMLETKQQNYLWRYLLKGKYNWFLLVNELSQFIAKLNVRANFEGTL